MEKINQEKEYNQTIKSFIENPEQEFFYGEGFDSFINFFERIGEDQAVLSNHTGFSQPYISGYLSSHIGTFAFKYEDSCSGEKGSFHIRRVIQE